MFKSITISSVILLGVLLLAASPVFSQSCDWDLTSGIPYLPTEACPPWEKYTELSPANPQVVDDYLLLNTGINTNTILVYLQKDGQLDLPGTWRIEFEVKYVSGTIKGDYRFRTPCAVAFGVGGKFGNVLFIGPNEIFVLADEPTKGATAGPPDIPRPDADYQKYRIEIDVSGNSTPSTFRVYVNDIQQWQSQTLQTFYRGSVPYDRWISWGDPTRDGSGESHWRYLRHNGYSGLLTVDNINDDGPGSLRKAIDCANICSGPNTITFNLPMTITLATPLPALMDITGGTTISGKVGSVPRSMIIDGSLLEGYCLSLASNGNVLRDLVIDNIQILGDENEIYGCYIGVERDGVTRHSGTPDRGVLVRGNNNRIGGSEGNRNVIAGDVTAIFVDYHDPLSAGNIIYGNRIGVTYAGNAPLNCIDCSDRMQIGIDAPNVIRTAISGNVIGDCQIGIRLGGNGANQVVGNLVGIDVTRTTVIPNGIGILDMGVNYGSTAFDLISENIISGNDNYGILVNGRQIAIILNAIGAHTYYGYSLNPMPNGAGGIYLDPGLSCQIGYNIIAYNGGPGISVSGDLWEGISPSQYNSFIRNEIYNNAGLGIDLLDDGVTYNDAGDADEGPNGLLNFPEITSAQVEGTNLRIIGTAPPDARVEYFEAIEDGNPEVPGGEHGEALRYLGSADAAADGTIDHFIDPGPSGIPVKITATATDPSGNTSEFSKNVTVGTSLSAAGYSPINMMILDPDGLRFGMDADGNLIDEIPGAEYHTEPYDSIYLPTVKIGMYIISYVRDIGDPDPSPTYSSALKIAGLPRLMTAVDKQIPGIGEEQTFTYTYETGYHYPNGDGNRDNQINVGDAVYVINYFYRGGPLPDPIYAGDANCDFEINAADAVLLINYVFTGGPPPCYFEP